MRIRTSRHEAKTIAKFSVFAAICLALSVYMSFVHVQGEHPWRVPPLFWAIAGGVWAIVGIVMLVAFHLAGLAALIALTLLIAAIEGLCFLAGLSALFVAFRCETVKPTARKAMCP